MLMVEHHMEVVTGLAQRIAVLHHGSLLAVDTPGAIMRNETVQQAYLGRAAVSALLSRFATCTSTSASRTSCRGSSSTFRKAASPRSSAATASARRRRCAR